MASFTDLDITWRSIDNKIDWPAINIKNYGNIHDIEYPFRVFKNEMTDPKFNADWIMNNVETEQLNFIWECLAYNVIKKCELLAKELFGEQIELVQDGRMGGWLVLTNWKSYPLDPESYYYHSSDDWDESDYSLWNSFVEYVDNQNKKFMKFFVTDVYLNEFKKKGGE
jgi:hypothetical protein